MFLDSSEDEATLPLSNRSPPPSSPGFASRLQSSTRFLRSPRALLLAVLFTLYLALAHHNKSRRSAPLGYTSLGPQDGFDKAPEGPQLPILALPNGTRYQHPLRPSWPDPWPHRSDVAELLSSWRFPPPENAVGVDADSQENVARRALVGLGTKAPRRQFEMPEESLRDADSLFGRDAQDWKAAKLDKGEGYGEDGRPLQVPREALYTGRTAGWKPAKLGSKKVLPRVQKDLRDTRTEEHKIQDSQRREWVRRAFLHLWESESHHPSFPPPKLIAEALCRLQRVGLGSRRASTAQQDLDRQLQRLVRYHFRLAVRRFALLCRSLSSLIRLLSLAGTRYYSWGSKKSTPSRGNTSLRSTSPTSRPKTLKRTPPPHPKLFLRSRLPMPHLAWPPSQGSSSLLKLCQHSKRPSAISEPSSPPTTSPPTPSCSRGQSSSAIGSFLHCRRGADC